jgi:hypothetical protein
MLVLLLISRISTLWEGNGLDLDVNVLGQSLDGNTAASRLVAKPLLVLLVHRLEIDSQINSLLWIQIHVKSLLLTAK